MSNGFIETVTAYHHLLQGAVRLGAIDGYGKDTHPTALIVATVPNRQTAPANPGHAASGITQSTLLNVDKHPIQIIDSWAGMTPGGLYDAILGALPHNPVIVSTSYDVDTLTMADGVAGACQNDEVVWCGPSHDQLDSPADIADVYDNILVAISTDEAGNPRTTVRDWAIGVVAANSSAATAKLAGAYAYLKALTGLPYEHILDAMRNTGDPHPEGFVNLRLDLAADVLMGGEIPESAPIPEPEPIPMPEYTETVDLEHYSLGAVQKWNTDNGLRGPEGFAQAFDGDPKTKGLSFNSTVDIEVFVFTPDYEVYGFAWLTANDSPQRDPKVLVLNEDVIDLPVTDDRFAPMEVYFDPVPLSTVTDIQLTNRSGNILQLAEMALLVRPVQQEPAPEPVPDQVYPERITLTFPGGLEKTYTL